MTNAKPSRRARRSPAAARARAESLERRALLSGFISISNATVIEGDAGFRQAVFNVHWHVNTLFEGASITAETSDGTASSLGDYVYKRQQLDFAPFGTRDLSFSVDVVGDTVEEADETFTATLSDPYNASIADGSVGWYGTARGLIVNDDHQPVDTQPPTAVITPVSPDPRESPVSAATITFSEPVTGVDVSDFTLQQDNGPNLLTAAQTATTSDGGVTWQLNGLQSLTGSPGQYLLALSGRGSTGIVDAAGNELSPFAIMEVWRVVPPPAPTNLAVYNLGTFNRLVFTDNSVAETAYRWEFHLPGHPQFDWTEGDSFPGNAPGQTGTITFDDVAFAGLSPSYRVWANHFDGTTATNSGYSNVASAVPAGLRETIYDTIDFHDNPSNPNDPLVRIDPEINHNFDAEGAGSPAPGKIGADRFSIVWEGTFTPTQTGNFVVYGGSDDGIRVYLNGVLVVDAFVDRGYTETPSTPLALTAGDKYDLRVEYYENYGGAGASLKYEGPGTNGRQVIPFTELSPPTAAQPLRPPIDIALTHVADCITVWFHDLSASETGYEVLRTSNPRGGWTSIGTTPANADHFIDPGPLLSDGTSYYYLVRALGPNGAMSLGAGLPDPVTPTPPGGPVDYANFWDNGAEDAFTFNGSATLVDRDGDRAGTTERLMLTDAVDGQDGSAYLYSPMSVDGFTAGFDFQVTDSNGADGFTFILQSSRGGTTALGLAGGGLGYDGIRNSVAVKYDFYPGINQTGLYIDGQDITDDSADARNRDVPLDFDFDNGQVYRATVSYDANSKVLTQTIDDIGNPATAPFMATYPIDIPAVIGKCAYVGFTGATGGLHARQEILSFKYTNYVPPPPRGPRVQSVYVSGTGWDAALKQYLEDQGMGSSRFGFAIGSGAAQTDELPWTNINQVSMTFDKDAIGHAADLAVRGVNVGSYAVTGYAYDPATHTATWTLARALAPNVSSGDRVMLDLDADAGVSAGGLALDGEFVTGARLPSGDGTPGGDFHFALNVLPADGDRSGRVNALDLSFVKQRLNKTTVGRPGAAGSYSPFGDFDAGGRINALDLAAVKQRLNIQLPPPPPAAPASLFADRRIDDATPLSATSMLLA